MQNYSQGRRQWLLLPPLHVHMTSPFSATPTISFIGGGNMASAILGGLLSQQWPIDRLHVVEPFDEQRARLKQQFGIQAFGAADANLADSRLVVWAVKPQTFQEAANTVAPFVPSALHLSVAAGIRSDSIARWLNTEALVRAMPNTPALVGKGMTGLFARDGVSAEDRALIQTVLQPTGQLVWLKSEAQLDAVTALSGSGPAYVFFFLEAMIQAGAELGLDRNEAHQLAVATFVGASALAQASDEPPELLRQRVTSKGGTTYAAITHMESTDVKRHFVDAMKAAAVRAKELGDEFGA